MSNASEALVSARDKYAATPTPTLGEPKTLAQSIELIADQVKRALPASFDRDDADRFIRSALTLARTTPAIADCEPSSVLGSLMTLAQFGLEIGPLGEAYLVPFSKNVGTRQNPQWVKVAQLIIGYQGLIVLSRRSGLVDTVVSHPILPSDEFEFDLSLRNPLIRHKPNWRNDEDETPIGFYALAHMANGSSVLHVMNMRQVHERRAVSESWKNTKSRPYSPWTNWPDEMGRKTAVRGLSKWLPLSIEERHALAADDKVHRFSLTSYRDNRHEAMLERAERPPAPEALESPVFDPGPEVVQAPTVDAAGEPGPQDGPDADPDAEPQWIQDHRDQYEAMTADGLRSELEARIGNDVVIKRLAKRQLVQRLLRLDVESAEKD